MSKSLSAIFWGIFLILTGGLSLAQALGYEAPQNPVLWAFLFGGAAVVSLVFYILDGFQRWAWLFPVGIFAALAFLMGMAANGVDQPALAAPLFVGIGLPFCVAYFMDRTKNWWALIPAGLMAFFALMMFAVDQVRGEWIGAALFFVLATIFFLVYLGRRAVWAAIVAWIMFMLGFMPWFAMAARPELSGIYTLVAIALPFWVVYFRSAERWWAIIPAGILSTMAFIVAIVMVPEAPYEVNLYIANAMIFAGMAGTFAVVGFRHDKRWGMILALVNVVLAIAALLIDHPNNLWAIFLIAAGVYMVFNALRPRAA